MLLKRLPARSSPAMAFEAGVTGGVFLHIVCHAPVPSPPDRLSHRGDRRDTVSAGRAGSHRRRLRLRGAPAAGPTRETADLGVYLGGYPEDPRTRSRPRSRVLRPAG